MKIRIFQVDAFATKRFAGNPAAVMLMDDFPSDGVMQAIADENNLAETAFLVPSNGDYRLRWFTPKVEVPLFHTLSGALPVHRTETGYVMDFPSRPSEQSAGPAGLAQALGTEPLEVYSNAFNYMAVVKDDAIVRGLSPDFAAISSYDRSGIIVTAAGTAPYDFVSRYFAPAKGIPEDPVTGGAHTMLAPYWAKRLDKTELRAFQVSRRGGEVLCRLVGERVMLEGSCVFYMEGVAEF
jgi:predicted PhzF superfamily epimerase YddE/YHI9